MSAPAGLPKLHRALPVSGFLIKAVKGTLLGKSVVTADALLKLVLSKALPVYQLPFAETYKSLLSIDKTSAYAMMKIGHCYEKTGNNNKALAYYYKGVHYEPSLDNAWYKLAK